MAGRKFSFLADQYYHVFNRGAHKAPIFKNDADYGFLLKYVREEAASNSVSVIAYCLMGNHYHFLLRQNGDETISRFMQAVFNVYSKAFNAKYNHSGTLFEGPFRAMHVNKTEYLLHLCRYIHRNPLEAGMVVHPLQWKYSNYPEFVGSRKNGLVDLDFVHRNFGVPGAYEEFVLKYIPPEKVPRKVERYLF